MPKAAPTGDKTPAKTKNAQLELGGVESTASSQDLFGDMEDVVEYVRALFYGQEGSGKTTAALLMTKYGKVLVVDAEGGLKKKALASQGVDLSLVRTWPPKGTAVTAGGLDKVYDTLKADLEKDPESWAGIVIDSATDTVQALTAQVSNKRIERNRNKGAEIEEVDEYFTDVADYGTMSKMFVDKLRKFRDLPLHVVYTALERRDVDKNTSEVSFGPAVTPGVATPLLGYVDIVMHFSADDGDAPFRSISKQSGKYRTKDRFGTLPRVLAYPTMPRIIDYIECNLDAATDPLQKELPAPRTGKKKKASADDAQVEETTPTDATA